MTVVGLTSEASGTYTARNLRLAAGTQQALKPQTGQVTQPSAWTSGPPQSGQVRARGTTMVRTRIRRVIAGLLSLDGGVVK